MSDASGSTRGRHLGSVAGRRVDDRTPFLIGSVAKSFTATEVVSLAQRGIIDLSQPAARWVPELRRPATERITVRQLLSHTSGFSTAAGLSRTDRPDAHPGVLAELVAELASEGPSTGSGSVQGSGSGNESGAGANYAYSDANYLILTHLVEIVTGQGFAATLQRDVLTPLGLSDTTGDATKTRAGEVGGGHRSWWGVKVPFAQEPVPTGAGYGYLTSTPADLLRFGRAQLAPNPVLDAEGLRTLHRPQVDSGPGRAYAAGWRVDEMDGLPRPVLHHTGATPGYFSHLLVDRQSGTVVVVLANSYSEAQAPALAAIGPDLLRERLGAPAERTTSDPVLRWAPFVPPVLALGLAVFAALVWTGRSHRPRTALFTGALSTAASAAVPTLVGQPPRVLALWAPDLAVGLVAVAVSGVVLLFAAGRALRSAAS
ncbi:beta-lactamase family protein [Naumannella sp. ID2617S]|nr:beta-lactamase family protein [Naumannella sp. ID2617S]